MASSALIIAESGSGKSTAIENLNPKETFIINVSSKDLPFPGWKKKYTVWSKENQTGNMYKSANPKLIETCMKYISEKRPDIKVIVIDDWQYMSSFEFFDRASEKGFDKFNDIGSNLTRIGRMPQVLRDDLTVFYLTHSEEGTDIEGRKKYKAKTIGKMVDEKLTLEGLFTTVLFGKVKKNSEGEMRYVFETQNSGDNTCKSPKGMFADAEIPNDLNLVLKAMQAYDN